jgi:hypothetical protein
MGVSGQRHALAALYPRTHCTKGWMGPRASLNTKAREKIISSLPGIEPRSPGHPARSQTLYWLSCLVGYSREITSQCLTALILTLLVALQMTEEGVTNYIFRSYYYQYNHTYSTCGYFGNRRHHNLHALDTPYWNLSHSTGTVNSASYR